jgi:hypothetical protein
VVPSPKFQSQEVGEPVLVSVNVTVSGAFPEVGIAVNEATGGVEAVTTILLDFGKEVLPALFVTVKLTVKVPALLYVCTGFFSVELVLSPKVHLYEAGDPVLRSVNVT